MICLIIYAKLNNWAMRTKIQQGYLRILLQRLAKYLLNPFRATEEACFCIMGSTGISYRGKTTDLAKQRDEEIAKATGHSRVCALINYLKKPAKLGIYLLQVEKHMGQIINWPEKL
jgi:hypothetical protein